MIKKAPDFTYFGFGLGLRPNHYQEIEHQPPAAVDWFEIISEDYLVEGGSRSYYLDKIAERYPLAMHGVSLSIGSIDPLNWEYLRQLKSLANRIKPLWISDHFCWTGIDGINLHDLMPLPHTESVINHVVQRIKVVQDFLEQPILLENVSSYIDFIDSKMPEWQFITEIAERANCYLLLDINNVFVNAYNHKFDPDNFLKSLPKERVVQLHLSGHKNCETHIIDTHDSEVVDSVWDLYITATHLFPNAAVLLERDGNIPPLAELISELQKARQLYRGVLCKN